MKLEEQNKHLRDSRISFDEPTHSYTIDGSKNGIMSVTTLIHQYFPHFNAKEVIKKMQKNMPEKYKGMTNKEIEKMWQDSGKEASSLGTTLHKSIEYFYNDINHDNNSNEYNYFLEFNENVKNRLRPYRTEWSIFRTELKLAGQLDMLYEIIDKPGEYALYDWKRVKEIKTENSFEKGKEGLNHLDHCNYNHYSIQLNIYKRLLETLYGLKIVEMFLVVLHPENETFKLMEVFEMKKEIDYIFRERKKKLN